MWMKTNGREFETGQEIGSEHWGSNEEHTQKQHYPACVPGN
jgi:hypothetical protein